jgi:hypothetical protein
MIGVFYSAKTRFQARCEAECLISWSAEKYYRMTFVLDFSADQMLYFAHLQFFMKQQMLNFLTYKVANPIGCIFSIMILY